MRAFLPRLGLFGLLGLSGLTGRIEGQIPHRYLLCDEGNANLHLVESAASMPGPGAG